jgi:hypothetical protein
MTNATEKKIAAHLRRNSRPTPINVTKKQKEDIETRAGSVRGPSRARWLMKAKRINASKTNVTTPNALMAVVLITAPTRSRIRNVL